MTVAGEVIGLPEYCIDIAGRLKTHVVLILDHDPKQFKCIEIEHFVDAPEFHEFQLEERPGLARF